MTIDEAVAWLSLNEAKVRFETFARGRTVTATVGHSSFTAPVGSEHKGASKALAFVAETLRDRRMESKS